MRDFNVGGNIRGGRDVNINIQSNQPNSFDQCTKDYLYAERHNRKQRLAREKKRKIKWCSFICLGVGVIFGSLGVWYYMSGNTTLSGLILGLVSIGLTLFSIEYVVVDRNELQQLLDREIQEINLLLTARDAQ
jgi:hypothetical protein